VNNVGHLPRIISRSVLLRIKNISPKTCWETQNAHCIINNFFFRKSCHLWNNVMKFCRAGQATHDDMAHMHCMPDTWGYKYARRLCNTHSSFIATMVAQTRLNFNVIPTLPGRNLPASVQVREGSEAGGTYTAYYTALTFHNIVIYISVALRIWRLLHS